MNFNQNTQNPTSIRNEASIISPSNVRAGSAELLRRLRTEDVVVLAPESRAVWPN